MTPSSENLISKKQIQEVRHSALLAIFRRGDEVAISFQRRFLQQYLSNGINFPVAINIFSAGLDNNNHKDLHFLEISKLNLLSTFELVSFVMMEIQLGQDLPLT